MSDKDINLTMDTRVLVKQVLSTLPQMGNQINVINIQSVHQGNGEEIENKVFCFDLEFEKFFEMLPQPRIRNMIDFCYQLAIRKFNGNAYMASRFIGVSQKSVYNYLAKAPDIFKELEEQPLQMEIAK